MSSLGFASVALWFQQTYVNFFSVEVESPEQKAERFNARLVEGPAATLRFSPPSPRSPIQRGRFLVIETSHPKNGLMASMAEAIALLIETRKIFVKPEWRLDMMRRHKREKLLHAAAAEYLLDHFKEPRVTSLLQQTVNEYFLYGRIVLEKEENISLTYIAFQGSDSQVVNRLIDTQAALKDYDKRRRWEPLEYCRRYQDRPIFAGSAEAYAISKIFRVKVEVFDRVQAEVGGSSSSKGSHTFRIDHEKNTDFSIDPTNGAEELPVIRLERHEERFNAIIGADEG